MASIAHRRKVQNHIGGVHATATALLAETATGMVVGMNLPDEKLPRFQRPPGPRALRTRLLKFYEKNCKPRSCPFIVTWFVIEDLQAGPSSPLRKPPFPTA